MTDVSETVEPYYDLRPARTSQIEALQGGTPSQFTDADLRQMNDVLSGFDPFIADPRYMESNPMLCVPIMRAGMQENIICGLLDKNMYRPKMRGTMYLDLLLREYQMLRELIFGASKCNVEDVATQSLANLKRFLPDILQLLWTHRHAIFEVDGQSGYDESNPTSITSARAPGLPHVLERDIEFFVTTTMSIIRPDEIFLTREIAQIFVYFWAYTTDETKAQNYAIPIHSLFTTPEWEELRQPVFEAVMDDANDARVLLTSCAKTLCDPTLVDLLLLRVLYITWMAVQYCPDSTYQKIQGPEAYVDPWIVLLRSVVRSCERQICLGDPADTIIALRTGVSIIGAIYCPRDDAEVLRPAYAMDSKQGDLGKLDMISVVAHFTLTAVRDDLSAIIDDIWSILSEHTYFVESSIDEKCNKKAVKRLIAIGRRCIGPTLAALYAYVPQDAQTLKHKEEMIEAWEEYHDALGLSNDTWTAADDGEISTRGACALKSCLCSRRTSHLHKMRHCKGCKQVMYCGRRCQTRDWEEGHKERCRRSRREQDTR